ncbi:MAG: hypothetical protein RLZZ450_381 [Pseudomonadota bacterium]|jgi:hypothetical protein
MATRQSPQQRTLSVHAAMLVGPVIFACSDNNDRLAAPPRADRVLAWLAIALVYLLARWVYAARRPTERRATRR